MLLLVSGASGGGKSTVRQEVAPVLGTVFESAECRDFDRQPDPPTTAWRQWTAELAVRRAVVLQDRGRHLLLSGDPIAPGEVAAAPAASRLEAVAMCVLDLPDEERVERLRARGDPEESLPAHLGFAQWMREHAADPLDRLHVLTDAGRPGMRWDRLATMRLTWTVPVLDVGGLSRQGAARVVLDWVQRVLGDPRLRMPVPA